MIKQVPYKDTKVTLDLTKTVFGPTGTDPEQPLPPRWSAPKFGLSSKLGVTPRG